MYSFSYVEPVCCSMSRSNCCFLTCIQISQEAGQVVGIPISWRIVQNLLWYTQSKALAQSIEAEIGIFLELSCFFDDLTGVGNLISGSSAFSKTSLNIRKFTELNWWLSLRSIHITLYFKHIIHTHPVDKQNILSDNILLARMWWRRDLWKCELVSSPGWIIFVVSSRSEDAHSLWLGDPTPRYQPQGYSQILVEVSIVMLFWNKHHWKVKEIRCESSNVIPKAGKMNELSAMVMNWVNLKTYYKMEKAGCRMIDTMALHSTSIYLF